MSRNRRLVNARDESLSKSTCGRNSKVECSCSNSFGLIGALFPTTVNVVFAFTYIFILDEIVREILYVYGREL
jgi:hypothetical protein